MNSRKWKKRSAILLAGILAASLFGCGKKDKTTLSIAQQFGIAYAPLNLMEELGMLEEKLDGIDVKWTQFGGPTGIREAMLNGEVDFGFMGVSPVLVGISNGMEWKYATGISANQAALVSDDPKLRSLADFTAQDRIAILSPGCTQHILLCMMAEEQLGDAAALDGQLVSMTHPDAMNALMAETEITAHFATPPYLQEELKQGMHIVADAEEVVGGQFTFITGVAMTEFYETYPNLYDIFIETLNEAIDYINQNTEEAVKILAPLYGITEEELAEQMGYGGTIYTSALENIEPIKQAMYEMGYISENFAPEDIIFNNVEWK